MIWFWMKFESILLISHPASYMTKTSTNNKIFFPNLNVLGLKRIVKKDLVSKSKYSNKQCQKIFL